MTTLDSLSAGKYISVTTFRKTGEAVPTPVWVTREGDHLFVITGAESGKVKRMRNNSQIEIAPCDVRGKTTGPAVGATVELLDPAGTAAVEKRVSKKFGLTYKMLKVAEKVRRKQGESVGLQITLNTSTGK
ncbi:MAG: PPOX class F420-dependent oxidoreductase [Actinobacteria bacterium]|nr:PPOX class F420-dependent oxidoreductase [Actinomycetota bacterium]